MAKLKVFELAQELNVSSKDIMTYLSENGIVKKSHLNNIEEKEIEIVKAKFEKKQEKKDTSVVKSSAQTKVNQEQKENSQNLNQQIQKEVVKNIPQEKYSGNTEKHFQNQEKSAYNERRQGDRPMNGEKKQNDKQTTTEKKQNDRPMNNERRQGDRPNNNGERRQGDKPNNNGERKQGDRPNNNGERRQGDRPNNNGERRQGDRPNNNGERRQGDKPNNNGERRQGDRPNNNGERRQGDRPNNNGERRQGDRPNNNGERRQGDRPNNNGERRQNDRPNNNSERKQNDKSSYGQKNNNFGGNRSNGNQGGYGKDRFFDKDKDSDSGHEKRQQSKGGYKNSEKNSIKSDLANELTKEQRAAAFSNRDRDKNRDKKKEHEEDFDKLLKSKNAKETNKKGAFIKPVVVQEEKKEDEIKTIIIPESLTLKELADKLKQPAAAIVKKLFLAGKIISINQEISFEEAEEIALEYNCIVEKEVKVNVVEELLKEDEDSEETLTKRPPVVCVMGHVDHGKTSLLDAIRLTNVTSREAGGITQHIGAYMVEVNGEKITFLDTPGHEAFTAMRMRGAKSTDIAILVVAADDGVMPQTIEAISHAKAAGIEIIVAVNKIDKPAANIERVKQELTEYGLIAEDWGGDTIFVPVSAHTKEGIDKLLEMIILTSEIAEYKANPNRKARGIVIEAQLDKGRGPVATILVQKGTLHVGDTIAIGSSYGKVRAMMDDTGRRVKEAIPSTPVEILGLNGVPDAGEVFLATETEKEARTIAEAFISQSKEKLIADTKARLSLDGLFSQIQAGNIKELNLIVKADVQGSVEAVKQSLLKLSNEEVAVRVIHGGVGAINESDVTLASASNAIIIGFNVKPDNTAKEIADREKVDLRLYRVIYSAIEDIEAAMKGMLDPEYEEKIIGHAEVRQTFKASGLGVIAGSYVLDGKIVRGCKARITREGTQLFDGPLASLKRFKDDVKEVAAGYECGLVFEKFNDLQEFDQVELYMMVEVPRK